MIWRDKSRVTGRDAGFTLIEMIVVLAILGLAMGLILMRGPLRSPRLEQQTAAREIMAALRLTRTRAIARDHPMRLVIDVGSHMICIDGDKPEHLVGNFVLSLITIAGQTATPTTGDILFAADGSSSGGAIDLVGAGERIQIGVDWLTGGTTMVRTDGTHDR